MQVEAKPTLDGLLAFLGGALALIGVWWSNHQSVKNLAKQLDEEKAARNEDLRRETYGTAALLRSEIISIWEQDMHPLSATMAKVPKQTGTQMLSNGMPLPRAPVRYFPVFERCVGNVGLLSRETISLAVQFYKRIGELLLAWDEYHRCAEWEVQSFDRLYKMWKGLEHGYTELLKRLSGELSDGSGIQDA